MVFKSKKERELNIISEANKAVVLKNGSNVPKEPPIYKDIKFKRKLVELRNYRQILGDDSGAAILDEVIEIFKECVG